MCLDLPVDRRSEIHELYNTLSQQYQVVKAVLWSQVWCKLLLLTLKRCMYTMTSRGSPFCPFQPACPWGMKTKRQSPAGNRTLRQIIIQADLELHLQENLVHRLHRVALVTLILPVSRCSRQHLASPWAQPVLGGPAERTSIHNRSVRTHHRQNQYRPFVLKRGLDIRAQMKKDFRAM